MKLEEMTWPEVQAVASQAVALLPLGSIEQHGPHLAVSTDSALAGALASEVERQLAKAVVLCPALTVGSSHHHLAFPGTLSLSPSLYSQVVEDLVRSLLRGGFRRIVLLNGHGGNVTPVQQALAVLSHAFDDSAKPNIALATYWELAGKAFAGEAPMESPALSHACEYETSLMLHLFPPRVRMDKAGRSKCPTANEYLAWEGEHPYRGVTMVKQTHFISDNGGSGSPHLATAAKGKILWERALAACLRFVTDFKAWPLMEDLHRGKS